jgi:hypothetical protein
MSNNISNQNPVLNQNSNPISENPSAPTVPSNTSQDMDLKKALTFLMSNESKEYSIDKKREFLLKKLPPDVVEKAIQIYPLIESNLKSRLQEQLKEHETENKNSSSIFSSFFNLSILSSVLLTSLGINYLLDMHRNKKNDLFYKECERKLNEELAKNAKEMKQELSVELHEYVTKESLKEKIKDSLTEYTQQRGLNMNLSSKSVKEDIVKLKQDLEKDEKMIKDLNIKIDNNKVILKEEILKETSNLVEESNNKLLMKIIENQDRLLSMVSNAIRSREIGSDKGSEINPVKKNESPFEDLNQNMLNNYKITTSQATPMMVKRIEEKESLNLNLTNQSQIQNIPVTNQQEELLTYPNHFIMTSPVQYETKENLPSEDNLDFSDLLENTYNSIKEDKDKLPFIMQLKNQFSAINETIKKEILNSESNVEEVLNKDISLPHVNITNRAYKAANSNMLSQLLKKIGFKNESGSVFKYDQKKYEELQSAIDNIESFNKK